VNPISNDLRKRIVEVHQSESLTFAELASRFKVSLSAAHVIVTRFEKTGCYKALEIPGREPKLQHEYGDALKNWVEQNPDITLGELAERLECNGKKVHPSSIKRVLDKLGFTYKKKRRLLPNESARMSSDAARNG
jgi:transposase